MKGLELSEKFYKEYGEPMLQENFSDILPYIAVGLAGSGSECYGYDDGISVLDDWACLDISFPHTLQAVRVE